MEVFKYAGKTSSGGIKKGVIEAASRDAAVAILRQQGVRTTSIKPKPKDIEIKIPGLGGGVKEAEIVIFTRQFATMIDAGLPLVQCLDILSAQTENKNFAKVISAVKQDVEDGSTYADALRKHPNIFSDLYVNMVEAGEVGGILDTILNRLAGYIEKAMKLKKKVKGAMVYPATVVSVAVIVVVIIMVYVIPVFQKMFSGFGGVLPAPTRLVIAMSEFLKANIFYIIMGLFAFVVTFSQTYKRNSKFKKGVHIVLLKFPLIGPLIRKVAVAKFTRTLGTLISSGVPILDGMDIVARTANNKVIEEAVMKTRTSIQEGRTISEPLAETKVFPPMVVQMIGVGEQTGALDSMLSKIADFYDEEVDNAVSALTSMLEPIMMVFLGGTVGFLVVSMYLPVFRMADMIH
ncbi:MAG: type II secretion system F family protein [Deltaproteobacteria bacterium]|nr:type II secretion system F family protein [Deltaproteobacteria bacterium]